MTSNSPNNIPGHRPPYVGDGADGARRSAEMDRSEADGLPTGPHDPHWTETSAARRDELLLSAERWELQADELEAAADGAPEDPDNCGRCFTCIGSKPAYPGSFLTVGVTRMIVCAECGNKRCPHGTNHRLECRGSNDPGQPGSRY